MTDIEDLAVYGKKHLLISEEDIDNIGINSVLTKQFILDIISFIEENNPERKVYDKYVNELSKLYKLPRKPRQSHMNLYLKELLEDLEITVDQYKLFIEYTLTKKMRTQSGVLVVAVSTSPGDFSCPDYDCHYCPKQKGMPRSYVKEGPSMRRASKWGFDCVKQIHSRLTTYSLNGHEIGKIEVIVLGGTWSSYPMEYREKFVNECYYAFNTFFDDKSIPLREMKSMEEEQKINESTRANVIGYTIETRPDCITSEELDSFRRFGVTRVQIGVQHTNNRILKKINRKCTIEEAMVGIKNLKNNNFKVLTHWMPNLPDSSPEKDIIMLNRVITDPNLNSDEVKIYPTIVTSTSDKDSEEVVSVIEKWYNDGKYIPYSDEDLMEVLIDFKCDVPESLRIGRLFRDIPKPNSVSGCDMPNMREIIHKKMEKRGMKCKCIRCMEVKDNEYDESSIYYGCSEYEASDGMEYFIYCKALNNESGNEYLLGFIRLRLPYQEHYSGSLPNYGLIRELHVYSPMKTTYKSNKKAKSSQHKGIGKNLVSLAENKSISHNYDKTAIISGVGVRNYYRKLGYELDNGYMVKQLITERRLTLLEATIVSLIVIIIHWVIIYYNLV